jgi:hypothetical protein
MDILSGKDNLFSMKFYSILFLDKISQKSTRFLAKEYLVVGKYDRISNWERTWFEEKYKLSCEAMLTICRKWSE